MKLQIDLSQWPRLDLDLNPEDMAAVISALMLTANKMKSPVAVSEPEEPVKEVPEPLRASQPTKQSEHAAHKPVVAAKKVVKQAQARPISQPMRAKGESHKRRDQVRIAFEELQKQGIHEVTLRQVSDYFKKNYPEEDLKNLDQVVRDLSNKGEELESVRRGVYRLVEA